MTGPMSADRAEWLMRASLLMTSLSIGFMASAAVAAVFTVVAKLRPFMLPTTIALALLAMAFAVTSSALKHLAMLEYRKEASERMPVGEINDFRNQP